jgi:muconolactone delta-isomerase
MRFLVTNRLKEGPTDEVKALIPAEQARTKELSQEGLVEALYIAADRSGAWLVWNVDSKEALEEIHKTLPLHDHIDQDITLLADPQ